MYMDNVLLLIGAVMLAVAASLGAWLLVRRRKSAEMRRSLRSETEKLDVMETLRSMARTSATQTETL